MLDISIILFIASLIGIIVLFSVRYWQLKSSNGLNEEFPAKDLSYESFRKFSIKLKRLWLVSTHTIAIIVSKSWARLTHYLASSANKLGNKIEEQIIKTEKNGSSPNKKHSIFLTTVKAYKHEIKKLKGRIEPDKPKMRVENKRLDKSTEKNKIE